ncbi:Aspergillopepsin-2, partial [Lachnellula suecica]
MKFSNTIFGLATLALVSAAPSRFPHRRSQNQTRSGRAGGMGAPNRPVNTTKTTTSTNSNSATESSASDSSEIVYSTNWAGAVYSAPPSGETFSAVSASFVVPTASVPSNVDSTEGDYGVGIWVGIDGYTYSDAILQTGIDIVVSTSGEITYDAWYEWYPDVSESFNNIQISAGDNVTASVTASSSTSGVATIENLTTGQTATMEISSTYALEGENAEWIVEDYSVDNALIAFADFGDVTFVNCVASTSSSSEGITDATIMDLDNSSGEIFTSVSVLSSSALYVAYNVSGDTSSDSGSGMKGFDVTKEVSTSTSGAGKKMAPASGFLSASC